MRVRSEFRFTVSCPCGAWASRCAMTNSTPDALVALLREHEDHCDCTHGARAHAPHLHVARLREAVPA